jgi:hypothetical protein
MPYKVFMAPTGSGNVVFEGDVVNGYTSPDGKRIALKFYSNDRGYTCGAYDLDFGGAKALRDELAQLLEANCEKPGTFKVFSSKKHFSLAREIAEAPLILAAIGTNPVFGTSYHRGDAAAMQKVLAEFDTVLKSIGEVVGGKLPTA